MPLELRARSKEQTDDRRSFFRDAAARQLAQALANWEQEGVKRHPDRLAVTRSRHVGTRAPGAYPSAVYSQASGFIGRSVQLRTAFRVHFGSARKALEASQPYKPLWMDSKYLSEMCCSPNFEASATAFTTLCTEEHGEAVWLRREPWWLTYCLQFLTFEEFRGLKPP